MPSEATVLSLVRPGNETGRYYITFCNLPFGTTWQRLKDWLRPVCKVEHIEIFSNSTSGWARFKGKDNFESAWQHINGEVFFGRSIIASDKNRDQPIQIKELAGSSQKGHPETPQTPRHEPATPPQYGSPTSPCMFNQYATASYDHYQTGGYPPGTNAGYPLIAGPSYHPQPSISSTMSMPSIYATADPRDYYNTLNPSASVYLPTYGYEGTEYSLPYRNQPNDYGSPTETFQPADHVVELTADYPGYLPTEKRKVIISTFPVKADVDDVKSWVIRKCGPHGHSISDLEVPRSSNRDLRGYALAIFHTAESANKAMRLLQRERYQDIKMAVRFTTEGVTPSEATIPTGPKAMHGDQRSKGHRSKHNGSKGSSSKHSSPDKKHSSDKKTLSSSKRTSSSTDKKKSSSSSSDRKDTRDAGPVIADGTSRKHDSR